MRIFVTGIEGYIGSVLGTLLLDRGHHVIGLDTGYYRDGWLYSEGARSSPYPRVVSRDLRRVLADDLRDVDAVVHLAELSNDPLGENNPDVTYAINYQGSVKLAALAKQQGIKRFVYTSSCSVYGVGDGGILNEQSNVNPQTAYAKCKVLVERDVAKLADAEFCPTFLRNATAFGPSPRMRFDIVLNNLAGLAWTTKRISMTSDGTPWRPLVHISDISRAIMCVLEAPEDTVRAEIFNVGQDSENYRIKEIAEIVGDVFPDCDITFGPSGGDNRSYRVSFAKIHRALASFRCDWTVRDGTEQLRRLFELIEMDQATFGFRAYTRLRQLQYLQRSGQIDGEFFWRPNLLARRAASTLGGDL